MPDSLYPGTECLEPAPQGIDRTSIFFNSLGIKRGFSGGHIAFAQNAPVLAVVTASKIPFVIKKNAFIWRLLVVFSRIRSLWLGLRIVGLTPGTCAWSRYGKFLKIKLHRTQQFVYGLWGFQRLTADTDDERLCLPRFFIRLGDFLQSDLIGGLCGVGCRGE